MAKFQLASDISFNEFLVSSFDEICEVLRGNNLGIVIGRGQELHDEGQKQGVYKWLNGEIEKDKIDYITYGADYKKKQDNKKDEVSLIYELVKNTKKNAIAVTNPNNLGSSNKYLAGNTRYLVSSEDSSCWGGGVPGNPVGATKTTLEFSVLCKKVVLYVVDGGRVSSEELEIYNDLGVEIKMVRLYTPAVRKAKELGIKMTELEDKDSNKLQELKVFRWCDYIGIIIIICYIIHYMNSMIILI